MQFKSILVALICVLVCSAFVPAAMPVAAQPPQPVGDQPEFVPGILIVGYEKGSPPRLMDLPREAGMAAKGQELQALNALNIVKISVPVGQEEQIRQELLQNPDVRYVEMDYLAYAQLIPNDPRWPEQYGPQAVNAPEAWDITTGSSDIVLAVIDSGIDSRHPEFSGRLARGYDFIDDDSTPQDDCGHGTHVAGIAAATGNNRRGVAGIDWHSKVMPIRVIHDTGASCSGPTSGLASGIVYAVQHGAKVINLSVGLAPGAFSQTLEDAVTYAYQQGVAVFAAAGNYGGTSLLHPASAQYALAVGAANRSLTDKASFSNASNLAGQRMVVAPGVNILSTTPNHSFLYEEFGVTRNYGILSGTSMATPHVSGAATLMAALPAFDTPDKIYQAIIATALDIGPEDGWDRNTGYGLLQIELAMGFEDFTPPPVEEPGVVYDYVTSVDCPEVTYEWDDASGGLPVPLVSADARAEITLSAPIPYAGQSFSSITVSANGYVSFGAESMPYSDKINYPIPWPAPPNLMVAPYWSDLSQSVGGGVYYLDLADRLIVQWDEVSIQGMVPQNSLLTFQVIFYRTSGHILFQYRTLRGPHSDGDRGTVGLEYGSSSGTQVSYNQAGKLRPEMAILFVPAEPGSTRNLFDCLLVTREDFLGCNQLPPFGVDLPDTAPPLADGTELTIRLLRSVPRNWPENFLPVEAYAGIDIQPDPPEAVVCYTYTGADVLKAGGRPQNLFLANYRPSGRRWERLPTVAEPLASQLRAEVDHFSIFGVFALQPSRLPETGADLTAGFSPLIVVALGVVALALLRRVLL